jgi:hypothetical protein
MSADLAKLKVSESQKDQEIQKQKKEIEELKALQIAEKKLRDEQEAKFTTTLKAIEVLQTDELNEKVHQATLSVTTRATEEAEKKQQQFQEESKRLEDQIEKLTRDMAALSVTNDELQTALSQGGADVLLHSNKELAVLLAEEKEAYAILSDAMNSLLTKIGSEKSLPPIAETAPSSKAQINIEGMVKSDLEQAKSAVEVVATLKQRPRKRLRTLMFPDAPQSSEKKETEKPSDSTPSVSDTESTDSSPRTSPRKS